MSVDLQEPLGVESAHASLDEFRASQDEFSQFFGDVFDQLQALSLELFARHKCLEASTEQKPESGEGLAGCREEFQRWIEELQQLHGQFQTDQKETHQGWTAAFQLYQDETRTGLQRFLDEQAKLREIGESFRQIAAEFSGIKADVQRERKDLQALYANVESQLSRLSTLTAELTEAQARPTHDSQIAEILEHTRQQQAEWLQQRATLETELEAMRHRAAEQAEALGEQKRIAGQNQAELAGELKRMRSLLEALGSQVRGGPLTPGERTPGTCAAGGKPADHGVLASVLAQFEMLQRDISSRRATRKNETDHGGKTFSGP